MRRFKDLPLPARVAIGSGGSLMFGILLGYAIFPTVFNHQLKKELSLRNKTDLKELWTKVPFPLDFKVWMWNVTNPTEVQKGGKPVVREVGPYYYEKWIEKVDLVENKEEDSIEYNRKDKYIFKPELSGGLTGDEYVYTPHLIIIATANFVAIEKPSMLKIVMKALKGIYDNPTHVFPPQKVKDLLFDGVVINCNSTEFAPKAVCDAYKKADGGLVEFKPNYFKFSYFGSANGTDPKRLKVRRGINQIDDVGKVIGFDGKSSQEVWNGGKCNEFKGTDATVFKPFVTKDDELWTFSPEICRSIGAFYKEKSSYMGIKTLRFVADLGDLQNEPDNQCFCKTPDSCPAKGLMDVSECTKGPIVISLPHFHKVDPKIQSEIIGQNPDKEKHEIFMDFEPISGTPMTAKKRLQLNCKLMKIPQMELFAELPDTYVPFLWIEEGLSLGDDFVKLLKHQLFYPLIAVKFLKWFTIAGGFVGLISAIILYQKDRVAKFTKRNATVPVATAPVNSNSNSAKSQEKEIATSLEKESTTLSLPGTAKRY